MRDRPSSERLIFTRVTDVHHAAFHALLTDAHVRRFLLDGAVLEPAQTRAEITASEVLFASHGVGLWLLAERAKPDAFVGFAGFRIFEEEGEARPQLLYALTEPHTGRGLATEAAAASISYARERGFAEIVAGVDAPNVRSIRVLEALGFRRTDELAGGFGPLYRYVLAVDDAAGPRDRARGQSDPR